MKIFKRVFICHPISVDAKSNMQKVRDIVRKTILDNYKREEESWFIDDFVNYVPVAPYLYLIGSLNEDSPKERELGLNITRRHIHTCNLMWVFSRQITKAMEGEIIVASRNNVEIKFFDYNEFMNLNQSDY